MRLTGWNFFCAVFFAALLCVACTPEENKSDETDKTVHVTGISLNKSSATIEEGASIVLEAIVTPDNADNRKVLWSSNNSSVATVDEVGTVLAVSAGSATITAKSDDSGITATCLVSVTRKTAPSITIGTDKLSAISAILKGKANIGSSVASDLKIGFQYSKSAGIMPSNSTTVEAEDADADYNYTTAITGLEPDTKYYFRSFVLQNGQYTYGETINFTTKEVASMIETREAENVEAVSATLTAKLDLTDVLYGELSYGFLWGASESALDSDAMCAEIKNNAISASLTGLSHKTQYWFKSYVKFDKQTFYGEVNTFTTDVVPVMSISLDKTEYTFNTIGDAITLSATVLPTDATDNSLVWSTDNDAVATVDNNGRVTANGNGKATITVTTKDQGKTATCAISVAQWVAGITLDESSITLNEGDSYALTVTVNPDNAADKTLTWASSDESIAKVNAEGKVTAVSKGSATIKASATDGSSKYASCSVTVNRLVGSIELDKTSITIYNGKTETITATVTPSSASNTSVSWTSSNYSVATVSSTGVVTGKNRGTTTITVTANDGSGITATCDVEVKQYVTDITIDKSKISLLEGESQTITATISPDNASDKTLIWTSSDNAIAIVDNTGKVTAQSSGEAIIRATANDSGVVYDECQLNVFRVPEAIDLGVVIDGKSIKWASFNLGASLPGESGYYYSWGETEPKRNYGWSTYKWCNGSSTTLTKYNTNSYYGNVHNKTTLEPEDDVAHVKLGGNWRMPTYEEWSQLKTQCTWTKDTQNGVSGRKVTGKNGKSIFLPNTGLIEETSLLNYGNYGYYWSSSLRTGLPYDGLIIWWWYPYVDPIVDGGGYSRCSGLPVRPVSD